MLPPFVLANAGFQEHLEPRSSDSEYLVMRSRNKFSFASLTAFSQIMSSGKARSGKRASLAAESLTCFIVRFLTGTPTSVLVITAFQAFPSRYRMG
jgi:hypothetical protein